MDLNIIRRCELGVVAVVRDALPGDVLVIGCLRTITHWPETSHSRVTFQMVAVSDDEGRWFVLREG